MQTCQTDAVAEEVEKVWLEATGVYVRKDKVEEAIRRMYKRVLRDLGSAATPGSPLKQKLEDYADAAAPASKASSGKLIERHKQAWGRTITKARKAAEDELKIAEAMVKMVKRQTDINDARRIEERAIRRYEKACEGHDRVATLIKDLKAHLQAVA